MRFIENDNALIFMHQGELGRIEAWGKDSLRVRSTRRGEFSNIEWALTEVVVVALEALVEKLLMVIALLFKPFVKLALVAAVPLEFPPLPEDTVCNNGTPPRKILDCPPVEPAAA